MTLSLGGRPLPLIGRARVYVCGITPYDTTHLGHAATFVWTDVLARVLRADGLEVEVCRNITDVDDHLLAQARARGTSWRALATRESYRFEEDMRLLGIGHPAHEPQSHNYVDEVIALASALLDQGAAYERDGRVWFRGDGVADRAGLTRDEAVGRLAETRSPEAPPGDDELDVALWQPSLAGEPSWDSPWGGGRPGWHAECAAMALSTLGAGIDVHAGGADLAFPHHAYEAAHAERATGVVPFARSWMHVGVVRVDGAKMAKSAGNLVFVHELLEEWPPGALRLLLLERPWHQAWDYSADALAAAADRLDHLRGRAARPGGDPAAEEAARRALHDDLDVPAALAVAEEAGGSTLQAVATLLGIF